MAARRTSGDFIESNRSTDDKHLMRIVIFSDPQNDAGILLGQT